MILLGIGCFWFSQRASDKSTDDFSPERHLEEIKAALDAVDNLSNVHVAGAGASLVFVEPMDGEDEEFFPIYGDVKISFDIFLPFRLREKYGHGRFGNPDTDQYHVTILYRDQLPITYIHYAATIDPSMAAFHSPSDAIIFVREYLKDKLRDSTTVRFESLGPSPLHADILLHSTSTANPQYHDLTQRSAGYRTMLFDYATGESNLLQQFITDYNEVLSIFYRVVRSRNLSLHYEVEIINGIESLIEYTKLVWLKKLWQRSEHAKIIDTVFKSILDDKLNRLRLSKNLAEEKNDSGLDATNPFYVFVQRELDDRPTLPTEDIKELLSILEDRRQNNLTSFATLASGLVGGAIGAILASLLAVHSISQPAMNSPTKPEVSSIPSPRAQAHALGSESTGTTGLSLGCKGTPGCKR